jgi:hypothetical protein
VLRPSTVSRFMSVASRPFNPLIEGDDDLVVAGG